MWERERERERPDQQRGWINMYTPLNEVITLNSLPYTKIIFLHLGLTLQQHIQIKIFNSQTTKLRNKKFKICLQPITDLRQAHTSISMGRKHILQKNWILGTAFFVIWQQFENPRSISMILAVIISPRT